jgi:hypothetical protein
MEVAMKIRAKQLTREDLLPRDFERFAANIQTDSSTGCWNWQGAKTSIGYGALTIGDPRHLMGTHKIALAIFGAGVPEGLFACHKCDNPACCNPNHLFVGNQQDNMADKVAKGRQAKGDTINWHLYPETVKRGESHHNAKLNKAAVIDIKTSALTGAELAIKYNISRSAICAVRKGRMWSHITIEADPSYRVAAETIYV